MSFSTKRGRPKSKFLSKDLGTIELQQKRAANLTEEPIDICLKKGLITNEELAAALHFRWLYNLIFGSASPQSSSFFKLDSGFIPNSDDPQWRIKKQNEYYLILDHLKSIKSEQVILNICVFNQTPVFLTTVNDYKIKEMEYMSFKNSLQLMCKLNRNPRKHIR